jgi:hypothetical protein
MSELFARFFELLAMSRDVGGWGEYYFTYLEASKFFANTINWFFDTLNPILLKKSDIGIVATSAEFISNLEPYKKKWTDTIKSRFANVNDMSKKYQELNPSRDDFIGKVEEVFKKQDIAEVKKLDNGVEYMEFGRKK